MKYSELIAMVYAARQIGTTDAKSEARAYIYASETVKAITREQRMKLTGMLNRR